MRRFLILLLVIWSSQTLAQSGMSDPNTYYNLIVETDTVELDNCIDDVSGAVLVHRFYIEAENPTDRLSAVFGNDQYPLLITAPGGVYNNVLNSSWSASGVNPALFGFFPCLPHDSYATIGLDGSAAVVAGAEDPSLVQDESLAPTISTFFNINTLGQFAELNVNTLTGGSWYALYTSSNGLPNEDGRWYIMQLTSQGHVEGVLNYQVWPLGLPEDQQNVTRSFSSSLIYCDDPEACNYSTPPFNWEDSATIECDYSCCPGPGCCGEGTTWDSESQTCLTTYLHDADFDGCVGLSDLLSLLSAFGSCLEE